MRFTKASTKNLSSFMSVFIIVFALFIAGIQFATLAKAQNPQTVELSTIVAKLADAKKFDQTIAIVEEIAATATPEAVIVLQLLTDGNLRTRKSDGLVYAVVKEGKLYNIFDPITAEAKGQDQSKNLKKVRVNNKLRRQIRGIIGNLTLAAKDPDDRMSAAQTLIANPDGDMVQALESAIASEQDANVKQKFEIARAASILFSNQPDDLKMAAIDDIAATGSREVLALLGKFTAQSEGDLKTKAEAATKDIKSSLKFWDFGQTILFGLSLGSILLLAAIGLAITFGVMGVINMAHGEIVMLGAYTTFMVQEVIRGSAPWLLDWSLAIALPLAFLISGAVGMAMERGIIRHLYGRPLETLLATWGVSLVLQQAVRTIFGPTNKEVSNPSWMSGAFELGQMSITWNRMYIVIFALVVFAVLLWALNKTSMGLQMRAVTQNRRMASSMGIKTPWVDALTFGLGSGIAGIAGVALSQVDNVSPNLGQGYIIDSFMVVVFGGVGNLWGTLVGALSLGIVNKFLEPYAGAVLGKVFVLVFIILFIQKRPRGLFALKGRSVEQ
jgi:urea transport system permease protein